MHKFTIIMSLLLCIGCSKENREPAKKEVTNTYSPNIYTSYSPNGDSTMVKIDSLGRVQLRTYSIQHKHSNAYGEGACTSKGAGYMSKVKQTLSRSAYKGSSDNVLSLYTDTLPQGWQLLDYSLSSDSGDTIQLEEPLYTNNKIVHRPQSSKGRSYTLKSTIETPLDTITLETFTSTNTSGISWTRDFKFRYNESLFEMISLDSSWNFDSTQWGAIERAGYQKFIVKMEVE